MKEIVRWRSLTFNPFTMKPQIVAGAVPSLGGNNAVIPLLSVNEYPNVCPTADGGSAGRSGSGRTG